MNGHLIVYFVEFTFGRAFAVAPFLSKSLTSFFICPQVKFPREKKVIGRPGVIGIALFSLMIFACIRTVSDFGIDKLNELSMLTGFICSRARTRFSFYVSKRRFLTCPLQHNFSDVASHQRFYRRLDNVVNNRAFHRRANFQLRSNCKCAAFYANTTENALRFFTYFHYRSSQRPCSQS